MQKGFTLIELLITVSIIGVLSSIILFGLSQARGKGIDTAIISNLATIQAQAELYAAAHNAGYGTNFTIPPNICPTSGTTMFAPNGDAIIARSIAQIKTLSGANVICMATGGAGGQSGEYAVQASLRSGVGGKMYWCVDSAGNAMPEASPINTAGTAVCAQ